MTALRGYFDATGVSGDWESIENAPNEHLVTTLSMGCPFEPPEKQALIFESFSQADGSTTTFFAVDQLAFSAGPAGIVNGTGAFLILRPLPPLHVPAPALDALTENAERVSGAIGGASGGMFASTMSSRRRGLTTASIPSPR